MKYLCLFYLEPADLARLAAAGRRVLWAEQADYLARLAEQGHLLAAEVLQPAAGAVRVRERDGRLHLGVAPCAAAAVALDGFCLLEARDLNEAVRLASGLPSGRLGCIEVRPAGPRLDSPEPTQPRGHTHEHR